MGPAAQYLAGELSVDTGLVIPLQASHNTVGMRFDVSEADYLHLAKRDASFPLNHLHHLADVHRHQVRRSRRLGSLSSKFHNPPPPPG